MPPKTLTRQEATQSEEIWIDSGEAIDKALQAMEKWYQEHVNKLTNQLQKGLHDARDMDDPEVRWRLTSELAVLDTIYPQHGSQS